MMGTPIIGNGKTDNKCISSLKGIAIMGVVLVHCGLTIDNSLIQSIVANGARGVQLFFIINAFLIFRSLSKIEFSKENILQWWKRKFTRLLPMYWLFTILYLAVFGLGGRYWLGTLPKVSLLNIVCNLLCLHGFFPYYINSINANWFMADLAVFYLLAPFLYKLIDNLEKSMIAVLVVSSGGYILYHFMVTMSVLEVSTIWQDYVTIISFPAEFPIMLLGILAYYILLECLEKVRYKKCLSMTLLMSAALYAISLLAQKDYFKVYTNIFSFGIVLVFVFISQMITPCKLLCNRYFAILGRHSYGIYLSHLIVMHFLDYGILKEMYQGILFYILVLMLSLGVAVVTEKIGMVLSQR